MALISISILPKAEADENPVGEAWDEPNVNPKLIKPTEGRGFGDRLAAIGLGFPNISLPKFNFFRNLMIMIAVLGTIFLILMTLMVFKV